MTDLRYKLVSTALEWEKRYGVAPSITSSISEYDSAMLIGLTEEEYSSQMQKRTVVSKGHDFEYNGKKYQVKACRPSGKPGSIITKVPNPRNYEWDYFLWMQYEKDFTLLKAYLWDKKSFIKQLGKKKRLSPLDIEKGKGIYFNTDIKKEYEFMVLKNINKTNDGYEGVGILTFDIIKCLTTQEVSIKQKEIPTELKKYVGKKLKTKGKGVIEIKCDASECRYPLETIYDGGEEFGITTSAKGYFKIISIVNQE